VNNAEFNMCGVVCAKMYEASFIEHLRKIAEADAPVLITGETGTGKEVTAMMIYKNSLRKNHKYLAINCNALPDTLLESTLFGHKKGSFTSAIKDHTGYFEEANNGTILLDEISESSLNFQTKLLRVIENRVMRKVGDTKDISINIRIIASCNKNLSLEVKKGNFRADLFYRLNTFHIHIPPLRERIDDLKLQVKHFLKIFNSQYNKNIIDISDSTMEILLNQRWEGNVRHLKNVMEYSVVLAKSEMIQPDDLPTDITGSNDSYLISPEEFQTADHKENNKDELSLDKDYLQHSEMNEYLDLDYEKSKEIFEKKYLMNLLEKTNGNIIEMVNLSNINRQNIYRKIKKYGIDLDNFRNKK
jgi:two-component system NtrC family response regulator